MSNTLKDFFKLRDGVNDEGLKSLFSLLEDSTSSIDCYVRLFNFCGRVLAKQSIAFRVPRDLGPKADLPLIDPLLEQIVTGCLDEELTVEDEDLVLYEGANFGQGNTTGSYEFKVVGKVRDAYIKVAKEFNHKVYHNPDWISFDQVELLNLAIGELLSSLPSTYRGTRFAAARLMALHLNSSDRGRKLTFVTWGPNNVEANVIAGVEPGTFYFEDSGRPGLVQTSVSKATRGYTKGEILTIDFTKYTINGKEEKDSQGKSRTPFFSLLKQITKWDKISSSGTYRPYYQSAAGQVDNPIALLRREPPGGWGSGIGRADAVQDDFVLWQWCAPDNLRDLYSDLPKLLGLPSGREMKNQTTSSRNGYEIVKEGKDSYVLTNTPDPDLATALEGQPHAQGSPAKRSAESSTKDVLKLFNFRYFRKIDDNGKVLKSVPKNSTRRPGVGDGPTITKGANDSPDLIGINLPVSFKISTNVLNLAQTKEGRRDIKNKASVLYKATSARVDAGTVMVAIARMGAIADSLQNELTRTVTLVTSKLPATAFTATVIKKAKESRQDWQAVKDTAQEELTVNQEWCHLQGHGDGGDERLGNFVSGSFHCNTEQLAMEEALRLTTHSAAAGTYLLRTTAYLLKDDGTVITKDYLANEKAYRDLLEENQKIVAAQLGKAPSAAATDTAAQEPPAKKPRPNPPPPILPVAVFIRYKIIKKEGGTYKKVWDYIFEGQSEFFDRNMYRILSLTVRFALAGMDAFKEWYDNNTRAAADDASSSAGS